MRRTLTALSLAALVLGLTSCGPSYDVHTMASPDARFVGLTTFRLLPVPPARDGRSVVGNYDPMVNNSIANRALRGIIADALIERGYSEVSARADFEVAVYASARDRLDVTRWDYGYPYWPRRPWGVRADEVTEYTEGTVVIDIVTPTTHELLWRGTGSTRLTEEPATDTRELQKVARAIMERFPKAAPRVVAER